MDHTELNRIKFRLFSMLEAIAAISFAIIGCGAFYSFFEIAPDVLLFVAFFVLKAVMIAISPVFRKAAIAGFTVSVIGLCVLSSWPPRGNFLFLPFLYFFTLWCVVPVVAFLFSIRYKSRLTSHHIIWIPVFEILIMCPIWAFVATFAWALLLTLLGIFPF